MKNTRGIVAFIFLLIITALVFVSCSGNTGGVPVTDENGQPVTDANGEVITAVPATEIINVTDSSGNAVTDASGNPVTTVVYKEITVAVPVTDENGRAVTDSAGNAVTEKIAITPTYSDKNESSSADAGGTGTPIVVPSNNSAPASGGTLAVPTAFTGITQIPITDGQGNTATDSNGEVITYTRNITQPVTAQPPLFTSTSWKRTYGGAENDYISAVGAVSGGYIALCVTNSADGDITGIPADYGKPSTAVVMLDENGAVKWQTYIGGSGTTVLTALSIAGDGSIYAGGYSTVGGEGMEKKGSYDAVVYKLSSSGQRLWGRSFGTSGVDNFSGLFATADGGVLCAGACGKNDGDAAVFNRESTYSTGVVMKLSSGGDKQWTKVMGGDKDRFEDVCQDSQGNIYLTGTFYSDYFFTVMGKSDGGVVMLNDSGEQQWAVQVAGSRTEYFPTVTISGSGNGCVIAGRSDSTDGFFTQELASRGMYDAYIVSVSSTGVIFWGSAFRGQSNDSFSDIICSDDGYLLTGFSNSTTRDLKAVGNRGGRDIIVACFTHGGELNWSRGFGGAFDDEAAGICAGADGYTVAGKTLSFDNDLAGISGYSSNGNKTVGVLFKIIE